MKQLSVIVAVCAMACAGVFAADGTWTATDVANASWSNGANWQGGIVAGDGGTATMSLGREVIIANDVVPGPLVLSALNLTLAAASGDYTVALQGGTNQLVSPAVITSQSADKRGQLSLSGTILDGADITLAGHATVYLGAGPHLHTGQTIISDQACVRVKRDAAFGPAPVTPRADAIVLDGGTLMNDEHGHALVVNENRGVELTANGGYLSAGYNNASMEIAGLVTGAGALGINFQNSPIILSNSGNDYEGDTVIGATSLGSAVGYFATLKLGANDVLPHGAGKGDLVFNVENGYFDPRLDLNGFEATVNGLVSTSRAVITSSVAGQGKLTVLSPFAFAGKLENGVMLSGVGGMSILGAHVSGGASIEVGAGNTAIDGLMFCPDGTLAFNGGGVALTNQPGFYEFTGPAEGNWPSNLARPLDFSGLKATADRVDYQVGAFAGYTQYCYRGLWLVPADNTYSFAGTFDDGHYLVIDGVEILSVMGYNQRGTKQGVFLQAGWHDVELRCYNGGGNGGRPSDWPSGIIFSPGNLDFTDNGNIALGQVFGAAGDTLASLDGVNYIFGRMLMNASGTITANPSLLGPPVFSGIVQAPGSQTLSFTDWNAPLLFGSPDSRYPAVLDGTIANDLILTNYAWLCRQPAQYTVATGSTLAFDGVACPDVSGGHLALNDYSLQLLETTPGISSVTVNAERMLRLSSRVYDDGRFVDKPSAFTATVVTLNGGALAFDNAQAMSFGGTFTGTGAISKDGIGELTLGGNGSGCGATFALNGGRLVLTSAGALCGAPLDLAGVDSRVCNVGNLTLGNSITAASGGFDVLADTVFEITSAVTGAGGVSKWGEGTLRLSGSSGNPNLDIHVREGTLELNKSSGSAVRNILGIDPGATVKITNASGDQIADSGHLQTSGGTFDLNGHSETVSFISNAFQGGVIVNNGAQPATLTVGVDNGTATYAGGTLRDGTSALALTKIGTGTQTLGAGTFQFSGAMTVDNGTLCLLPDSHITASLIRLTILAHRPKPDDALPNGQDPEYYNNGFQFGEFQLMSNGSGILWPLGQMTVQGISPNPAQSAALAVDNSQGNKWYVEPSNPLPIALTIACEQPMTFDSYRISTAGDAIGRDPSDWELAIGLIEADGVTTNWTTIDTQTGYDMHANRNTWLPAISISPSENDAIPVGTSLIVNADGTLRLPGFVSQSLESVTGSGMLMLDNDSTIFLSHPEAFTGRLAGKGTIVLNGTAGTISAQPIDNRLTVKNDGDPAVLLNDGTGSNLWGGNIQDGTASLGITQTAGTTYYIGQNSTYSGDTLLSGGEAIVSSMISVRYIRVSPQVMKNGVAKPYQLSRFDLMAAGEILAYADGTTAYGEINNRTDGEGTHRILDGSVNTKYFSDTTVVNPFVIVLPSEMMIDGYTWYTANDASARDMVSWTVEVSTDNVSWMQVDSRENQTITEDRFAQAGEWRFNTVSGEFCAFSPNSAMTIDDGARLSVLNASEPVGPLFGEGGITLGNGTLILCTFADADFEGAVSGNGTLIKQGAATQTFSGTLGFNGNLIVEGGTLNLDDAALAGVTNIVLRGGILTGSATVGGDLTITCEGGIYDAELVVSGALTVVGELLLHVPEGATLPYHKQLFTYQTIDPASAVAVQTALMTTALGNGINVNIRVGGGGASMSVSRGGTIIILR